MIIAITEEQLLAVKQLNPEIETDEDALVFIGRKFDYVLSNLITQAIHRASKRVTLQQVLDIPK